LDDIRDGAVYAKILTTDISAGHVKLSEVTGTLDDVDEGTTYVKVLATDISSGHLKLTSNTAVNGNWYDSSGVSIDASTGINIYGTDGALTTRATKTGTIQCKVDTTGAISAGAGTVLLNADGIKIKEDGAGGGVFRFYSSTDVYKGVIYYNSAVGKFQVTAVGTANLYLTATAGVYLTGGDGVHIDYGYFSTELYIPAVA